MTPTDPKIDPLTWPHTTEIAARDQPEYLPLPIAIAPARPVVVGGSTIQPAIVVSRWTFTPEERAAIAAGEDLYLAVKAFNGLQPVLPSVGPIADAWAAL